MRVLRLARNRASRVSILFSALVGGILWLADDTWAGPGEGGEFTKEKVLFAVMTTELGWVKNEGQWHEEVAFAAQGHFGKTWVTRGGEIRHLLTKKGACKERELGLLRSQISCSTQGWVISERFVGGEVRALRGEEQLPTKVSFFLGSDPEKHRSQLTTHRFVSLGEVWPGVEVKLKASQKAVERLFYVAAGADLARVQVEVEGAESLKLGEDGTLAIITGLGQVELSQPLAWQEREGENVAVVAKYKLLGENRYGFAVEGADPRLPLVIDPILQSTYLGGMGIDQARAIAVSSTGDIYIAGSTYSADFPATSGGAQQDRQGVVSAFVARLNPDLSRLIQSTYIGGKTIIGGVEAGVTQAFALAISPDNHIYIAGGTTEANLPGTQGGAQPNREPTGSLIPFVVELDPSLTQVVQATYLGGRGSGQASAVAIHPSTGEIYVAGQYEGPDFPGTSGGAQPARKKLRDAFVARLNPSLTQLMQSTYLGGQEGEEESANAIAISLNGDVYVAGLTDSPDFPGTSGGAQQRHAGIWDGFLAKLTPDLTRIIQATYLGGQELDAASALALDMSGNVYVAGMTSSSDFPGTSGGAQQNLAGAGNAFVAKLSGDLTRIIQSTYLGGSAFEWARGLAIATNGEVYVAGETGSVSAGSPYFPGTLGGAIEDPPGGMPTGFVARLDSDLKRIIQSTFLGGSKSDQPYAMALSASGDIYIAGDTESADFPGTGGGAQKSPGGSIDAFVARLTADLRSGPSQCCTLTVINSGTGFEGSGTITSSPSGIACGSDCAETYAPGTVVTLTATPSLGSTFDRWLGDCSTCGTDRTCSITMDGDKTCEAVFMAAQGADLVGEWENITSTCKETRSGIKCKLKGSLEVENRGNIRVPPGAYVHFFLSSDPQLDPGDELLKRVAIGALKPGQRKMMKFAVKLRLGENPLGKYLIAWIDATGFVEEADETNNIVISDPIQ